MTEGDPAKSDTILRIDRDSITPDAVAAAEAFAATDEPNSLMRFGDTLLQSEHLAQRMVGLGSYAIGFSFHQKSLERASYRLNRNLGLSRGHALQLAIPKIGRIFSNSVRRLSEPET